LTPLSAQHNETFTTLARQGFMVLEALQAQLDIEFAALQQRNLQDLQASTETKQGLLEQFSDLNAQRRQLLGELGYSATPEGIEQWFAALPPELQTDAIALWAELQRSLKQVARLNRRNEQVLRRNNRNNDQLLALLRGQTQRHTLYDASGSKGQASAQNRLGKA
jgi:flagellar biosynthesis/type III secretory pathway chaperone